MGARNKRNFNIVYSATMYNNNSRYLFPKKKNKH